MKTCKYAFRPKGKGYTVYRTATSYKKNTISNSDFFADVITRAIVGIFKILIK